jgi:hypothetical protein
MHAISSSLPRRAMRGLVVVVVLSGLLALSPVQVSAEHDNT